jgi:hypothetical protein
MLQDPEIRIVEPKIPRRVRGIGLGRRQHHLASDGPEAIPELEYHRLQVRPGPVEA